MDYGTGAIFGCPAHDQRDLDFAKKYNLRNYRSGIGNNLNLKILIIYQIAYVGDGTMVNSDFSKWIKSRTGKN